MLIINSAMKYAVKEKLCVPLNSEIHKPTATKKEISVLSFEAQQILEHFLIKNSNATNIGMLLSLNTGLRIGEVCALSWDDIDFNKKLLHVRHTVAKVIDKTTNKSVFIIDTPKTNASNREIPISDTLFVILQKYHDCSKSNYVVSDNHSFVSPRTFEYRYHRVLKKCDIQPINYHALRHTFATRCIEVGVDVKSLSEILGHANVSVTLNTYVHSSVELKRKQLEKLANISA